jgi:hypothetical protein
LIFCFDYENNYSFNLDRKLFVAFGDTAARDPGCGAGSSTPSPKLTLPPWMQPE